MAGQHSWQLVIIIINKMVELLLKERADPNIQVESGWTALMAASENGHQQVAELLLKKKADPNIQHKNGWTALVAASDKKWLSYSLKKRLILTFNTRMAGWHSWQLVKMVINKWLSYSLKKRLILTFKTATTRQHSF